MYHSKPKRVGKPRSGVGDEIESFQKKEISPTSKEKKTR